MIPRLSNWTALALCLWLMTGCSGPASMAPVRQHLSTVEMPGPVLEYDQAMFHSIEKRWDDLLNALAPAVDKHGKVVVQFWEHADGTVTHIETVQNQVSDSLGLLCVESVRDRAPFSSWPPEMSRLVGSDHRQITMTFTY